MENRLFHPSMTLQEPEKDDKQQKYFQSVRLSAWQRHDNFRPDTSKKTRAEFRKRFPINFPRSHMLQGWEAELESESEFFEFTEIF